MRHLLIAAPLHSDKRHDDEGGRDHPHPHHVGQLTRCDVEIVSLPKAYERAITRPIAPAVRAKLSVADVQQSGLFDRAESVASCLQNNSRRRFGTPAGDFCSGIISAIVAENAMPHRRSWPRGHRCVLVFGNADRWPLWSRLNPTSCRVTRSKAWRYTSVHQAETNPTRQYE